MPEGEGQCLFEVPSNELPVFTLRTFTPRSPPDEAQAQSVR